MRVFIGVGHGGLDSGAEGYGLKEKDINLDISLELKLELEKYGIEVCISRTFDIDTPAAYRIKKANSFIPDLAVDIHTNAGRGKGFEVYVSTGAHSNDERLAAKLIEEEIKKDGKHSRGIKTKLDTKGNDYFGFLRDVNFPSLILETAFIDSKDIRNVDSKDKRKAYARAYARGIIRYLGTKGLSCAKAAS